MNKLLKMWSYVLISLVFCISLCNTQAPRHCFSPPELTFKGASFNHHLSVFTNYIGQYDAHNQRLAYKGDEYRETLDNHHWIIMLYKEKTIFEINLKDKTCHKFAFKKFRHFGVPENAIFEDAYELGGPGESVEVEEWYEPHFFGGKSWVGVFSRKHCYPVSTFVFKNHRNESTTTLYSNVVEGLLDPEWFIPPSSCKHDTWGRPSTMVGDLHGHVGLF